MAKIGDIYLGGAEGFYNQKVFNSGIGFFLITDSKISKTVSFENGNWEVELKEGQQTIVARYTDVLSEDKILEQGFKYCQRAIDLVSIEYIEKLDILETGNFHTILYKKDDKFILKQVQTAFSTLKAKANAQVIDTITGNVIPQPAPLVPEWTPALRYYRLSQNTNDLYEAYKNAFLCFEFILNEIHPIILNSNGRPREHEKPWFIAALRDIIDNKNNNSGNENIDLLINYLPSTSSDPIRDFIEDQYKIRCELFHAKGDQCLSNIIVPAESFNPKTVSDAYEKLMLLLRHTVINYCNIVPKESGMSYSGFKTTMENNLSTGCLLFINDDDSSNNGNLMDRKMLELTENESENKKQLAQMKNLISPKKYMSNPSLDLEDLSLRVQYDINDIGIVKILGEIDKNELSKIPLIHRTSLIYRNDFLIKFLRILIFNNRDGIYLDGIDKFETNVYIKLKNIGDFQK